MSYMLLVLQRSDDPAPPAEIGRQRYASMMEFADGLAKRGLLVAAESLGSGASGTRLTKRSGKLSVLDGPFVEAKEIVGGFFLLNCATREEALAIANACPAVAWSTVELRAVAACFEDLG
jgi:hypothetical protein